MAKGLQKWISSEAIARLIFPNGQSTRFSEFDAAKRRIADCDSTINQVLSIVLYIKDLFQL